MAPQERSQKADREKRGPLFFGKVAVLGVGLIGASFALALKKHRLCGRVSGFGRKRENLAAAKKMGIIDSFSLDAAEACKDADLVMFSTPVGSFTELALTVAPSLKKGCIVTDAGSVKGSLVHEMERIMPGGVHYIGSHPIAGGERSGFGDSRSDLFNDAKCIVTATALADKKTLGTVSDMWKALGSEVIVMAPDRHDRIYGAVSHLPHMIAFNLVNTVAEIDASFLEFSGPGFRDATRIAAGSHELWRDICMLNRDNLIGMISVFRKRLDLLEQFLAEENAPALEGEFMKARALRERLGQN